MLIEGSTTFAAPQERVWELFNDPEALRRATPGCERLERVGEDRYEAIMSVGIAAVKGTYKGTIEIRDKEPPHRYRLAIQGSGSPGFVNIDAAMEFVPSGGGTQVNYKWDVQVGGAVAGVGQRVLGGVGRWLIGEFFKKMQAELRADQA